MHFTEARQDENKVGGVTSLQYQAVDIVDAFASITLIQLIEIAGYSNGNKPEPFLPPHLLHVCSIATICFFFIATTKGGDVSTVQQSARGKGMNTMKKWEWKSNDQKESF